jgi:hypothetical protein
MRAADVVQQVVHLYLVLIYLQQQVNITVKSHLLSQSHQNHIAPHHLLRAGLGVGDESADEWKPQELIFAVRLHSVPVDDVLDQIALALQSLHLLLFLSYQRCLRLQLRLQTLLFPQLVWIDRGLIVSAERFITEHFLPLFPQQTCSDENVERIIDSSLDVVLILPAAVLVLFLLSDDFVDQTISHLLVLRYCQLRNYRVH